jgi:hypothetical protein
MPVIGLRVQAYHLLALAIKAEEKRASDANELTTKAMEHLEDAMSVAKLRLKPVKSTVQSSIRWRRP